MSTYCSLILFSYNNNDHFFYILRAFVKYCFIYIEHNWDPGIRYHITAMIFSTAIFWWHGKFIYSKKSPNSLKFMRGEGRGGEDNYSNLYTVQCTMFIPTMLPHFESQKCHSIGWPPMLWYGIFKAVDLLLWNICTAGPDAMLPYLSRRRNKKNCARVLYT